MAQPSRIVLLDINLAELTVHPLLPLIDHEVGKTSARKLQGRPELM